MPVVILNKLSQKFVPEADDDKSSPEIAFEVVAQVVSMYLGMLFIHRIITFIPTHSKVKYSDLHVTSNILAGLTIILSLQTKLGEKVSILVDRIIELWEGPADVKGKPKKNSNVKVSQPISQNIQMSQSLGMNQPSSSTLISQLPIAPQITNPQGQSQSQDYVNMYRQDNTLGSNQHGGFPTSQMENEPVAANFGGGGSFGSSF